MAVLYYLVKVLITSVLVVAVSEVAKRSSLVGAILASIPLTSVLAMIWLYVDTGNTARVSALATSVFWLVLPSLVLFLALPWLLKQGLSFFPAWRSPQPPPWPATGRDGVGACGREVLKP